MSSKAKKSVPKKQELRSSSESKMILFPLFAIVIVLPLLVKIYTYRTGLSIFDWFPDPDDHFDVFLYYKQWFFVAMSAIAFVVIAVKAYVLRSSLKLIPVLIPLLVYAALALLSTLLSKYRSFGFSGIFEQFENIFVLLGYVVVVYYAFLMIRQENEVRMMIDALAIGAVLLGLIGSFQAFGFDLFASDFGRGMIVDKYTDPSTLSIVFGEGRTYATLYNPNYVGVYTSFMIPIFSVLLIYAKKLYQYILYTLVIILSLISLFGSQSKAGFISILVAAFFVLIFMFKTLLRRFYIVIPLLLLFAGTFFYINKINNNAYINAMKQAFRIEKRQAPALTRMVTDDAGVHITFDGYNATFLLENDSFPLAFDDTMTPISSNLEADGYTFTLTDERFAGIAMFPVQYGNYLSIGLTIQGTTRYFTNHTDSGDYQLVNRFGRTSSCIEPEIFAPLIGYEHFASNRGYIWSRTIPLLKDHILLGSGADSFIAVFPQHDYLGHANFGYAESFISKPHCLYLQMAVQTGVLSLIAFLGFYLIYFISCIRIYIHGIHTPLESIGAAIFAGTISYMVSAISNDSSVSVAPVFWVMIGVGIAVNAMNMQNKKEEA